MRLRNRHRCKSLHNLLYLEVINLCAVGTDPLCSGIKTLTDARVGALASYSISLLQLQQLYPNQLLRPVSWPKNCDFRFYHHVTKDGHRRWSWRARILYLMSLRCLFNYHNRLIWNIMTWFTSISCSYGLSKEEAGSYVLCDTIGSLGGQQWKTEGFRVVADNEKPLVLQSLWKPREGLARRFEIQKRISVEEKASKEKDTVTAGTEPVALGCSTSPHPHFVCLRVLE